MKDLETIVREIISKQKGVLFAKPTIVYRGSYYGRCIISPNSNDENKDFRGYYPVERWMISITSANNPVLKENEGISHILIHLDDSSIDSYISLTELISHCKQLLFGDENLSKWPLVKLLDIGGNKVNADFGSKQYSFETPPIPLHVHSGPIINGKCQGCGKLEAYFFPPLLKPEDQAKVSEEVVYTRLGFKPNISKNEIIRGISHFGKNDCIYSLCNKYEIKAMTGWTIFPGVVHSPGPWPTFEVQLPQDDGNLLAWKLGEKVDDEEKLAELKNQVCLQGLKDETDMVEQLIDLENSLHPEFEQKFFRPPKLLASGSWGQRFQIFFDAFYGEALIIVQGEQYQRPSDTRAFMAFVWHGKGMINNQLIDASHEYRNEALITPSSEFVIENTDSTGEPLHVYLVFPIIH